jgi:hypothetical protein
VILDGTLRKGEGGIDVRASKRMMLLRCGRRCGVCGEGRPCEIFDAQCPLYVGIQALAQGNVTRETLVTIKLMCWHESTKLLAHSKAPTLS